MKYIVAAIVSLALLGAAEGASKHHHVAHHITHHKIAKRTHCFERVGTVGNPDPDYDGDSDINSCAAGHRE